MDKLQFATGRSMLVILTAVLMLLFAGALAAQDDSRDEKKEDESVPTLDPRVAQDLLDAYELLEEDEYQEALVKLNRLMDRRGDSMKDFDKASVLQIRGTTHVNLEDMDSALEDFSAALNLEALPEDQQNRLRFNLAQIYFVNERYEDSIRLFEEWMQADVEVTDSAYFMLGAAYYNLDNYEKALEAIKDAVEVAPEPEKRYYDLLNAIYSQMGNVDDRTRLLETMVELWPDSLSYWRQLSSLYLEQGDQLKSFAALETAYVNGLITSGEDIIMLAQYYSTFDNPHRGAKLIEKEMEAGRVERSVDHLELLSQLWSQAREHRKAIPVLREAAQLSDDGRLSFRLGQALLADEKNEDAERALEAALEKGGLEESRRAEAWMLLGNARFNQADPGDREQRNEAEEAFAEAEQFATTRRQASDWRNYINAINRTERRQAALEEEQSQALATEARRRLVTACRAQQLAGSELSQQCQDVLAEEGEEGNGAGQ
ncbi:MAG TPA: tetratricopeptide repeat protein [Wenzhouxiangellaceae bacterium]|nr:tetratricopeptide repeat protein [Wenzhouxiangellaceae bacterium]